jgi:hypothetical protein
MAFRDDDSGRRSAAAKCGKAPWQEDDKARQDKPAPDVAGRAEYAQPLVRRHVVVARRSLRRIHITDPFGLTNGMSTPGPANYRTTNWSVDNPALRERGLLPIRPDNEMAWHGPHAVLPGRLPEVSDPAIQLCLSLKVLFRPAPDAPLGTAVLARMPPGFALDLIIGEP